MNPSRVIATELIFSTGNMGLTFPPAGLYGAELLPIDREFAHFATQRVRVDPQQTRRPVRSVDPPMGHRQGSFDVLFHRRVERQGHCDGRR